MLARTIGNIPDQERLDIARQSRSPKRDSKSPDVAVEADRESKLQRRDTVLEQLWICFKIGGERSSRSQRTNA